MYNGTEIRAPRQESHTPLRLPFGLPIPPSWFQQSAIFDTMVLFHASLLFRRGSGMGVSARQDCTQLFVVDRKPGRVEGFGRNLRFYTEGLGFRSMLMFPRRIERWPCSTRASASTSNSAAAGAARSLKVPSSTSPCAPATATRPRSGRGPHRHHGAYRHGARRRRPARALRVLRGNGRADRTAPGRRVLRAARGASRKPVRLAGRRLSRGSPGRWASNYGCSTSRRSRP